jgi:hypothetical protein
MLETMAKEAKDTWADDEVIPDIDQSDPEMQKIAK